MATLKPGMRVHLVAGQHKGAYGTVVRLTPCQVYVRVEGVEDLVRKYQTSVATVGDDRNTPSVPSSHHSELATPTTQVIQGQNNTETRQEPRVVTPPRSQQEDDGWSLLSTTSPPVRAISLCASETDSDDDDDDIIHHVYSPPAEDSVDDSFVTTPRLIPYDPTIHPSGTPAHVVGGTYLGRRGSIVRPTPSMVYVLLVEPKMEVRIRQNSVSVITTTLQRTTRPATGRGPETTRTTETSSQQQSEFTHVTVDSAFVTIADSVSSIENNSVIVTLGSIEPCSDAPPRTEEESLPEVTGPEPTKMFPDAIDVISLSSRCSSNHSMVTADFLYEDAVDSVASSELSMFDTDDASMATVETEFEDAFGSVASPELSTPACLSQYANAARMETAEPGVYEDALLSVASSETSVYTAVSDDGSESSLSSTGTEYHSLSEEYAIGTNDIYLPVNAPKVENEIDQDSKQTKNDNRLFSMASVTNKDTAKSRTASTHANAANIGRSERQTKTKVSTTKKPAQTIKRPSKPTDAHRRSNTRNDETKSTQEQPKWTVEGFDSTPHSFSGIEIDKVALLSPGSSTNKQRTFTHLLFGNRVLSVEVPVPQSVVEMDKMRISPTVDWHGRQYQLLSSKVQREATQKFYGPKTRVTLQYVAVSGSDLTSAIDLQKELNKVANFASLKPHKAAARLELLQSPAAKSNIKHRDFLILDDLTSADFEEIPEDSCNGCGYVPKSFIHRLVGNRAVGNRTNALQVRIFAPRLGILKGMLEVKPGIDRIQLPPSMRKVPPSLMIGNDWACLLVTNIFPSTMNYNVAKVLRGEPTSDSFKDELKRRRLKPMIPRIWEGLGVPREVSQRYVKDSAKPEHLKHAFVVGVADSTGFIPEGHVYVPGMGLAQRDTLFVTRCPCTELQDGHLLPVVTSKPLDMPCEMWKSLTDNHFGKIIFGNAYGGRRTLPELIANGDLDGDLYYICWSDEIISNVHPVQMAWPKAIVESEHSTSVTDHQWDWLPAVQSHVVNIIACAELHQLFGKLHTQAMKIADKSHLGIDDPDCRFLGRAYKKSLDLGKHGGVLYLPAHLWNRIPDRLHKYLTTEEQEEE